MKTRFKNKIKKHLNNFLKIHDRYSPQSWQVEVAKSTDVIKEITPGKYDILTTKNKWGEKRIVAVFLKEFYEDNPDSDLFEDILNDSLELLQESLERIEFLEAALEQSVMVGKFIEDGIFIKSGEALIHNEDFQDLYEYLHESEEFLSEE